MMRLSRRILTSSKHSGVSQSFQIPGLSYFPLRRDVFTYVNYSTLFRNRNFEVTKLDTHLIRNFSRHTTHQRRNFFSSHEVQRLKDFFRVYGKLGLLIYASVYLGFWMFFYLLLALGPLKKEKVEELAKKIGLDRFFDLSKLRGAKSTNLIVALICNKLVGFIRIPFAIGLTVYIVKILGLKYK